MKAPSIIFAVLISLSYIVQAQPEYRKWRSQNGREIEAIAVDEKDGWIKLKLKEGREVSVKLDQLSTRDQEYIVQLKQQLKQQALEAQRSATWPNEVRTQKDYEVNFEDPINSFDTHQQVYSSPNFIFYSDQELSLGLVQDFSWLFESTYNYVSQLPLGLNDSEKKKLNKVLLYKDMKAYHDDGGPVDSPGIYIEGRKSGYVLAPYESLGLKKDEFGYKIDKEAFDPDLSSEIVKLLTDKAYFKPGLEGWFTNGVATYITATPYKFGYFNGKDMKNSVKQYVTGKNPDTGKGLQLGDVIKVGSLEEFMRPSESKSKTDLKSKLGISAMIFTYFTDLKRDQELGNLQKALEAAKLGKSPEEILGSLLAGRSFEDLEREINKAWGTEGVILKF